LHPGSGLVASNVKKNRTIDNKIHDLWPVHLFRCKVWNLKIWNLKMEIVQKFRTTF